MSQGYGSQVAGGYGGAGASSDLDGGADSGPPPAHGLLIGAPGQEFVQATLSTNDPVSAIHEIQSRGALQDPRCAPLLGLLDQLGLSRAEAHHHVLQAATAELLARIERLPPERLLQLLEESFPFVGISDLRAVPLAILDRLHPVPASFLKQLATDRELFWELPLGVQRQVYELDKKLLQAHALPLVSGYTYEVATAMRALDMDECIPQELLPGGRQLPQLARRNLRSGSAALRRLAEMVGKSRQIYKGIVELCAFRFRDSDTPYVGMQEAALCALRGQLLMALHDGGEGDLCNKDPCHKLAWTLDASLKDRRLSEGQLRQLQNYFLPYDAEERRRSLRAHQAASRAARTARRAAAPPLDDDAESAGAPGSSHAEEPSRELGDAGMVLRDPSAFHLLCHQVVRRLEAVVEDQRVPKEDTELLFLTRLLQLATGCRAQMRERSFRFPEASPVLLQQFYPLLATWVLEAALQEEGDAAEAPDPADPSLVQLVDLLVRDEIVRKVTQVYLLERLAAGDLATGGALLLATAEALAQMPEKAVPEYAAFGCTLARRVAALTAAPPGGGAPAVEVGGPLWTLAVDRILVRVVDSETQVHEEVLRLLLAAAPRIPVLTLSNYLATCLTNSRRSRKRYKKRKLGEVVPRLGGAGGAGGAASADGVRPTYAQFAKLPSLTPTTAPRLFEYLAEGA